VYVFHQYQLHLHQWSRGTIIVYTAAGKIWKESLAVDLHDQYIPIRSQDNRHQLPPHQRVLTIGHIRTYTINHRRSMGPTHLLLELNMSVHRRQLLHHHPLIYMVSRVHIMLQQRLHHDIRRHLLHIIRGHHILIVYIPHQQQDLTLDLSKSNGSPPTSIARIAVKVVTLFRLYQP